MELPHIGQNCAAANCNQLDFLPFVCDGCGLSFCLQHKTKDNHGCSKHLCSGERTEFTGEKSYKCTFQYCEKKELTPIVCQHCSGNFCLDHRLQEDHRCVSLPTPKPEVSKTTQHVEEILAQRVQKPRPPAKLTNPNSIAMAAKVGLMKLKAKAVGDSGLPQSERVYFSVCLPQGQAPLPLFFSKVWSVGRVIDVIADKASITNVNNTAAEQKLRLFHGETACRLPVEWSLASIMADETNHLHSGATLVLASVPDYVDVLENIQAYKK